MKQLLAVIAVTFISVSAITSMAQERVSFTPELKQLAEQGDAEAQYNLGVCYYYGEGVAQDYKQAAYWWEKAANQENVPAQNYIGICYAYGQGVPQDLMQAVYWWAQAAVNGLAEAQYGLGVCYKNGLGVDKDFEQAVYWYEQSAKQDYALAQFSLGNCYYNGEGVPQDYKQAAYWWEQAAKHGVAEAQYYLGVCYKNGYGVDKDSKQAAYWWEKSAKKGYAEAQFMLGWCYFFGESVAQDYKQAAFWYEQSAKQGFAAAQYSLGRCYYNGYGVPQDYKQAAYWYEKAAEQGDAEAQYELGACYYNGYGVPQDYKQAVYWYEKAAKKGNSTAQNELGNCYYYGKGVDKDYKQAVYWYEKASYGNALAQFALGNCYYNGEGVPQDYKQAVYLWEDAYLNAKAEYEYQGIAEVVFKLGVCYENGLGVDKDYIKAVSYFEQAAALDHGEAKKSYNKLIMMLQDGGAPMDNELEVRANIERLNSLLDNATEDSIISSLHSKIADCYYEIRYNWQNGYTNKRFINEAINHYSLAIEGLKHQGKECLETARLHYEISKCYFELPDEEKAIDNLMKSAELCRKYESEDLIEAVEIMGGIGNQYFYKDNFNSAILYYEEALELYNRAKGENQNRVAIADLLLKCAKCYNEMGQTENANDALSKAAEIYTNAPKETHDWAAVGLARIGDIYRDRGQDTKAVSLYETAIEKYRKAKNWKNRNVALLLTRIGDYYENIEEFDKALEHYERALSVYSKLGDNEQDLLDDCKQHITVLYIKQGDDFYSQKRYDDALKAYSQANSFIRDEGSISTYLTIVALDKIGQCHFFKGEYDKAMGCFEKVIEKYHQAFPGANFDDSYIRHFLPEVSYVLGEIMEHKGMCEMAQGKIEMAVGSFSTALNYQEEYTFRRLSIILNIINVSDYWQEHSPLYQNFYPAAVLANEERSDLSIAYLYNKSALFSKGFLLNAESHLQRAILNSPDSIQSAYREMKALIKELKSNKRQERIKEKIDSLDNYLQKNLKEYDTFINKLSVTWEDVQDALGPRDIAIEFLSFPKYGTDSTVYVALTLRPNTYASGRNLPKMTVLCSENELKAAAEEAYTNNELSKLIWEKLKDELKGASNIYFSPCGELHHIAIESMPYWGNSDIMMNEYFNIYRLSSTREIAINRQEEHSAGAAVYGGINYDADYNLMGTISSSSGEPSVNSRSFFRSSSADHRNNRGVYFDPLDGTRAEAIDIGETLARNNIDVSVVTDSAASEASFKELSGQRKKIIHIATHGFYWNDSIARIENQEHPLSFYMDDQVMTRTGLLFSGANNTFLKSVPDTIEDGVLTALEVAQLDLRGLDVVVLSACQTGLGEIGGDGVFGLQRGFKKAGAQSIIMSLWKVNDSATCDMMKEFYKNYIEQDMSEYEAFCKAQRWLKDRDSKYNYSDPEERSRFPHWAAFILLDPVNIKKSKGHPE